MGKRKCKTIAMIKKKKGATAATGRTAYDYKKAQGKGCIVIDDETSHIDYHDCQYQSGRFVPRSDNVMLDAVETFCDMLKLGFVTEEIRVYLPLKYLNDFQQIMKCMGMVHYHKGDYILVML